LFIDGLFFVLVIATMLSLVVVVVIANLMWSEFASTIAALIQLVTIYLTTDLM
jgi:hypothetical protein